MESKLYNKFIIFLLLIFGTTLSVAQENEAVSTKFLNERNADLERYIVVLKDHVSAQDHLAKELPVGKLRQNIRHVYNRTVLHGYAGKFTKETVTELRAHPEVKFVEKDQILKTTGIQKKASYNLAITSEAKKLKKKNTFFYQDYYESSIVVYVLDGGIRTDHSQFEGRAYFVANFVDGAPDDDENGHGTHVAGIIGAKDYGVFKTGYMGSVKVANANGTSYTSDVVAAINLVVTYYSSYPSVINMSFGGDYSQALNDAVQNAVASGITMVTSAGNDNRDACNQSPASAPDAITVAAIDKSYKRASFSNYGGCVGIFAPGVNIPSSYYTGVDDIALLSGTSMSSPHIAGLAAYMIGIHGSSNPSDVYDRLVEYAEYDLIPNHKGSANRIGNNGYFKQ